MTSILRHCRPLFAAIILLLDTRLSVCRLLGVLLVALLAVGEAASAPIQGTLRIHPTNPRYFTDDSGEAVYLTGSHTWDTLRDFKPLTPSPSNSNFTNYLDFLEEKNHNFIRLWTWDVTQFQWKTTNFRADEVTPFPWPRSGAGNANDGKPKFDLSQFNQAYFDRLRSRVEEAGSRGLYTSVMLFEGFHLNAFPREHHPFDSDNNINGINGDPNGDGNGLEIHMGTIPAVTAFQEAYVRKVVDTVNDLDNVLYEIANESGSSSTQWQYDMINMLNSYQSEKPKQHPVGMTFQAFDNSTLSALLNSPADWISPGRNSGGDWVNDPPAADGSKVILTDSDHIMPLGLGHDWIWKSFSRGLNPILMDDLSDFLEGHPKFDVGQEEVEARLAMGFTLSYAQRVDLVRMTPSNTLCSTSYCLVDPGSEYLVYQPGSGAFDVTLAEGDYTVEWMHPKTGVTTSGGTFAAGSGDHSFTAPFGGDAVLYLKSEGSPLSGATMNLVVNGEFENPAFTQTFGGAFDLPNETTVPGWSNANPNTSTTVFQGETLVFGETLEIWGQGLLGEPTTGSDGIVIGHHAEVQVLDTVVGADGLTQSFVIPTGSSSGTLRFDQWDRNANGNLVVRVDGSLSGSLLDETIAQSLSSWTARTFADLAVVPGEMVTLSFSAVLSAGAIGQVFPHVDQVRFEVSILGDFDGDFDVDGADFLAWQRGESPDQMSSSDLADWKANFGISPSIVAASAAVPEPATGTLLLVTCGLLQWWRPQNLGRSASSC